MLPTVIYHPKYNSINLYKDFNLKTKTFNENLKKFFLNESDIGKNRTECVRSKLAELNTYVPINIHTNEMNNEFLKKFEVIIILEIYSQKELNIIALKGDCLNG